MRPFLKWPGGKRWLVSKYPDLLPKEYNTYFEPFLGGGAVFFFLNPKQAVISDINRDLINVYQIMARKPQYLRTLLEHHQENHSLEYYYDIRNNIPNEAVARAARFLYLNRTCYNGMYRVNRNGVFNVPIGTRCHFTDDVNMFEEYAKILKNVHIRTQDFVTTIHDAKNGDLIFADPPYATSNTQNLFIKYNDNLFSWNDQTRLLNALVKARERGATIISTNVLNQNLQQMYQQYGFYTQTLKRFSSISGSTVGRGTSEELLITSYPVDPV